MIVPAVAWAGSANLAAEWFKNLGFVMPYGVNMADFILDVASGAVVSPKLDPEQSQAHLIECSERCDSFGPAARFGSLLDSHMHTSLFYPIVHIAV